MKVNLIHSEVKPVIPTPNTLVITDKYLIFYDNNNIENVIGGEEAEVVTWSTLSGKPTTFPPTTHGHTWGEITGKPSTFAPIIGTAANQAMAGNTALLRVGTAATDAKAGNYVPTWAEVTGKPSTFTPTTHTHLWVDITDKPAVIAAGADAATARAAIGAGTGNSNVVVGTGATNAKAGNYTPSATEIVAAIEAMTPEQVTAVQTKLGITPTP